MVSSRGPDCCNNIMYRQSLVCQVPTQCKIGIYRKSAKISTADFYTKYHFKISNLQFFTISISADWFADQTTFFPSTYKLFFLIREFSIFIENQISKNNNHKNYLLPHKFTQDNVECSWEQLCALYKDPLFHRCSCRYIVTVIQVSLA